MVSKRSKPPKRHPSKPDYANFAASDSARPSQKDVPADLGMWRKTVARSGFLGPFPNAGQLASRGSAPEATAFNFPVWTNLFKKEARPTDRQHPRRRAKISQRFLPAPPFLAPL
jgi:hypothetical protein